MNLRLFPALLINLYKKQLKPLQISQQLNFTQTNLIAMTSILKPPEEVKNMQELDKNKFTKEITIPYLTTEETTVSSVIKCLKKYLLKLAQIKPIFQEDGKSVIFLDPIKVSKWDDIQEPDQDILKQNNITNLLKRKHELKYENYSSEDIFRAVLPEDVEGMASFTRIGHIVHVNLREHLLPYKQIIGQVLLDKVHACKTVVNKIDMIDNTYRNFQMEVLCGEHNFIVQVIENRCRFEFDFSKVYWNSRLCTEHERIVKLVQRNEILFDVFAGVGPFAIPAAKTGAIVYANDLNPESYKWLQHNKKINKIGDNLQNYNKDGRDFILHDIKNELLKYINEKSVHITMNLPALAVEFIKYFCNLYDSNELCEIKHAPTLYVYCFAKGENCETIARDLITEKIGWDISQNVLNIFKVRTVSSMKEMMRVTIKLDANILINAKRKLTVDENEEYKRSL